MNDTPPAPAPQPPPSGLQQVVDTAGRVVENIAEQLSPRRPAVEGEKTEILGPEEFYCLDASLLELLRQPLTELGLPIEDQRATMYDYDPNNYFYFFRIPLQDDYLALIYLRGTITETYLPNSNLAQMFDWLTQANPALNIGAIFFFTDSSSVDFPFTQMAEAWKRRGIVRHVEFVTRQFTDRVRRMPEPAQRKVALERIFRRAELPPRPAQPAPGPGEVGRNPPRSVADLENDEIKKDRLVDVLRKYLSSGLPALTVRITATNLITSTAWPGEWQNARIGALTEDAVVNSRGLVDYAIDQGNLLPPNQDQTALGNLLAQVIGQLGDPDLDFVQNLIRDFHLMGN